MLVCPHSSSRGHSCPLYSLKASLLLRTIFACLLVCVCPCTLSHDQLLFQAAEWKNMDKDVRLERLKRNLVLEVGLQCWGNGCFDNDSVWTSRLQVSPSNFSNKLVSPCHKMISLNSLLLLNLSFWVSESCSVVSNSLWPYRHIVHGILQARILDWVAFLLCRGSSQPRDWTQVSCIAGGFVSCWATREA